jgi:nucleotide-binding universal stress UspA family protein
MLRIDRVLYATDFSECSESALSVALRVAERYKAELHMLHAIVLHEEDPHDPAHHFPNPQELYEMLRSLADERLASASERGGMHEVEIVRAQVRGIAPAPVILDYAGKQAVDLIVMGTHGRRGLRHLLLGSVAEEVVRTASIPVLTVRGDDPPAAFLGFERVLVPMDYSVHSELALAYAKEIAAVEGAKLHLLHVLEPEPFSETYSLFYPTVRSALAYQASELKEQALAQLQKRLEIVSGPEVEAETHVETGHIAETIVEMGDRLDADLVVIASHGRTRLDRALLGSVAEGVVRRAKSPVLIVKPFGKSLLTLKRD